MNSLKKAIKKLISSSYFWITVLLLSGKKALAYNSDRIFAIAPPPMNIAPPSTVSPTPTPAFTPIHTPVPSPTPRQYYNLNLEPPILAIAPLMPPSKEAIFLRLLPVFSIFLIIITSIVGIIWYQKNKLTRKWYHFFYSKTFFITLGITIAICAISYWLIITELI